MSAADPAWRVRREHVKFGDVYDVQGGLYWAVRAGRVRVVKLVIDNRDDAPAPFYKVTLRYIDGSRYPDLKLAGPQIDYHLRRVQETP